MKVSVKVLKVDQIMSKKGNPLLIVFCSENGGMPFKVLCFDKGQVSNPPKVGQEAFLYNDVDMQLNGVLKLSWNISA